MTEENEIRTAVRDFILKEFLPDEDPEALTDDIQLITNGVLDSLATLKLVSFLEEQFGISVAAHEVDREHLDSVNDITSLVQEKQGG